MQHSFFRSSILLFALLLTACGGAPQPEQDPLDEFTFTEDDVARFRELAQEQIDSDTVTGATTPRLEIDGEEVTDLAALDVSKNDIYASLRGGRTIEENTYQVVHTFVNIRKEPRVTAPLVVQLNKGDHMQLIDFTNAAWAHIRLPDGREGFVSQRYIAKVVAEENLTAEREAFNGTYYVNFSFLNVRRSKDTTSDKIGQFPGQSILKPLDMDDVWARVVFEGEEGYVAKQYLAPFVPAFLVRQESYNLPILHYRLGQEGALEGLVRHLDALASAGYSFTTLQDLYDLVLEQEERDVRLEPKQVVVALSGITAENIQDVSDTLLASRATATLFIASKDLGLEGVTEKKILTLLANGFDLQSAGHSGDDLRSLTDSQVDLELRQSRQLLEEMTHKTVFAVLYPVGGVNDRIDQKAAQSGYLFGLGIEPKTSCSRSEFLRLPSRLVDPSISGEELTGLLGE